MAMIPKQLKAATPLTTSYVTMYTVPASTTTIIKEILLANTTAGAVTASVSVVPSAGTASTSNNILGGVNIDPNSTIVVELHTLLITGDFISAKASAGSAVNIMISGVETT
jgi:hypothetical protein